MLVCVALTLGSRIVTVQTILGHQWVDRTLGYARQYDCTLAADYYRAMASVELHLQLEEDQVAEPTSPAMLLALADALQSGTLNENQREALGALGAGLVQPVGSAHSRPERLCDAKV